MMSLRWRSRCRKKSSAALSRSMSVAPGFGIEAELAQQRNESHVGDGGAPDLSVPDLHQGQDLLLLVAQRNHQPSAGGQLFQQGRRHHRGGRDRKSTRLNSSHSQISYAVFCLKKKKQE